MNKICTTIEQSLRLIELDIDPNTADMHYPYFGDGKFGDTPRIGEVQEFSGGKDTPCWSLAALLGVMPVKLDDEYNTYLLIIDMDYKVPRYVHCGEVEHSKFPSWDFEAEELIDNVVESIFWLKENNLL